jgi:hypothetical protein
MISGGWIISHRCSWITVYVLYCNAQVNLIVIFMRFVCLLYFINCQTIICLPTMLFILWRDTSSELRTLVHSFFTVYYLLALFIFSQTTIFYHTICLILCLQQTGEIDNLTVSWGKVLGCVVCRFHVAAGAKLRPRWGTIYKLSGAVAKLASINLRKLVLSPTGSINLWFHTERRLAAVLIIPSSWGSQLSGHLHAIKQFFRRRCRGERGFLQGESLASNLLLRYCFALFYSCLHLFIKNTKK